MKKTMWRKINQFRRKSLRTRFLLRGIDHLSLSLSLIFVITGINFLASWLIKQRSTKQAKIAFEKLKAAEEKYRGLIESAQDAIIIVNATGRIDFVNNQVTKWFGYTQVELIGGQIEMLVPERMRDAHINYKKEYLAHPKPRPMGRLGLELKGRRKDGSEFSVDIALSPSETSEGKIVTAIIRDNTEREAFAAERAMFSLLQENEAHKVAEMAMAARDEFLLAAAHELRTPLTSLILQAHLIKKYFDQISQKIPAEEKAMSNLLALQIQFKHLDMLINKVLDASRVSVENLKLEITEVDLSMLVREISINLQEQNKVECNLEVYADQPVTGLWDRIRIESVITNLLTNAIKYGNRRPIIVKVKSEKEKAILSVEDHGIGISREDQEKLFLKFERFVSLDNYPGLGIGLYLSRLITEAHSGTISVKSELGKGSTFNVELPLKPPK